MEMITPATVLLSGPTGSGKTQWVKRLILEEFFKPKPDKIYWFYAEWQSVYDTLKHKVEFIEGMQDEIHEKLTGEKNTLLILDDLMDELSSSDQLSKLFTKGSHHRNISIIFILQNLYPKGKSFRNISLNAQYIVLYKNPRDKLQISRLGQQMGIFKTLSEAFKDATSEPYGYLLIDLKPDCPEHLRLRTKIFPSDNHTIVYQPK
jgi:ABC-type lipoprotein export system ATPase subunit